MASGEDLESLIRFGAFEIDLQSGELRKHGLRIKLRDQSFQVLALLLERRGQVVTREELQRKLWATDTFVDFERGLNKAINRLREALGDSAERPSFIETLPKRGYRFIARQPSQRTQTAAEMGSLQGVVSPSADLQQPSIAVLPFTNVSGDKEQEYFSDGLAEEIINALAQIPGLRVTARTSAFAFRGKEQDITKIAEALHVAAILEGSVRRSGSHIRVTAQLINAAEGYHIWGQRYDRELADVFAVQDEIAAAIAEALQAKLIGGPAARRYQPNLQAYDLFLRGRHELSKLTLSSAARAKDFLQQAIALDPGYSEPHAELGQYYFLRGASGVDPVSETMPAARAQAQKALELSPADPRAHALLCGVASVYDHDWKEAERQCRLALAADPMPPGVRGRCAFFYLLPLGRFQEALIQFERDLEQDPLSAAGRSLFALTLVSAGLYDRALAEAEKCLQIAENHWIALLVMSLTLVQSGDLAEARRVAEKGVRVAPGRASLVGLLTGILARLKEVDRVEELLPKLTEMAPHGLFWYHLLCSEIDAAADYYVRMIEHRDAEATICAAADFLKPLRSSSRWPALAKMMNLTGHARA
jgi:TolB-like protein/Tfp pilus assembly protein PilF